MSVVNQNGEKILLPAKNPDAFWGHVIEEYAHRDVVAWRRLAMLTLRELAGWTYDRIGLVFEVNAGTAYRQIDRVTKTFRAEFCTDRVGLRPHESDHDRDALIRGLDEVEFDRVEFDDPDCDPRERDDHEERHEERRGEWPVDRRGESRGLRARWGRGGCD